MAKEFNRDIKDAYKALKRGLCDIQSWSVLCPQRITGGKFDRDYITDYVWETLINGSDNGSSYFTFDAERNDGFDLGVTDDYNGENPNPDYESYGTICIEFGQNSFYVTIFDNGGFMVGSELCVDPRGVYIDDRIVRQFR